MKSIIPALTFVLLIVACSPSTSNRLPSQTPQPALEDLIARLTSSGQEKIEDNPDFVVYYSYISHDFLVWVRSLPLKVGKQKAENWFIEQGFNRQQLCEISVVFLPYGALSHDYKLEDTYPTGCPNPYPTPKATEAGSLRKQSPALFLQKC